MATWVLLEWGRRQGQGYDAFIAGIRERFGCGKTAAEQAYHVARERRRKAHESIDVSFYIDEFNRLAEKCEAVQDFTGAARIRAYMMDRTGHSAPAKLAIAARIQAQINGGESPHMRLLDETPQQRRKRLEELRTKALPAPAEASIDATYTAAPQAQRDERPGDSEDDGKT